jgi:hypothetical protein
VYRLAPEGVSVYQAARVRPVFGILLDYLAMDHREVDLVERQVVGLGLLG